MLAFRAKKIHTKTLWIQVLGTWLPESRLKRAAGRVHKEGRVGHKEGRDKENSSHHDHNDTKLVMEHRKIQLKCPQC